MKPILFNTEMVRAILEGRKTMTRRVVKEPYYIDDEEASRVSGLAIHRGTNMTDGMPYPGSPYRHGDILWVRETWARYHEYFLYKTNCADTDFMLGQRGVTIKWRPSIHMPREAARIFLRVTAVRVERLQDITEQQAMREGAYKAYPYTDPRTGETFYKKDDLATYRGGFSCIWDSTIPRHTNKFKRHPYYWHDNPWVWVIEFERIEKEKGGDTT